MQKIQTAIGDFYIRHGHDALVVKEVIEQDQYRRWGDITIKEGDIVIDLGAHIGSFTRLALYNKAVVYAYEPDADSFDLLIKNVELASPVEGSGILNKKAVIGTEHEVFLDRHSERPELNIVSSEKKEGTTPIPSVTLDSIIIAHGDPHIDLLKIDVEGCEYEIFYNSKYLSYIKQITMEWHYSQKHMAELILFLDKKGFKTVWSAGNYGWGHIQAKRI
jgi:FkbM family methyltransferase